MKWPLQLTRTANREAVELELRQREVAVKEAAIAVESKRLDTAKDYIETLRYPRDRMLQGPSVSGPEGVSGLPSYERQLGISEIRQQEENHVDVRAFLNAFAVHGIGPQGGTPIFNTPDKAWNKKANRLVNRVIRDCDYRFPDIAFTAWLKTAVRRCQVDGDVLAVQDDDLFGMGKLLAFEAEMIASVSKADAEREFPKRGYVSKTFGGKVEAWKQTQGVLHDGYGKVRGYSVSKYHSAMESKIDDCTIFTTEQARLLYQPERFAQYRGRSALFAMLQTFADFRDAIASELKSMKVQAGISLVQQTKGTADEMARALGITQQQSADGTAGAAAQYLTPLQPQHNENLEAQTTSIIKMGYDDKVTPIQNVRPNNGIHQFEAYSKQSGGNSIGLMKMFSTGEVSTSYSAARAELWLTWATFRCLCAWLENGICAWYYSRLINSLIHTGQLENCPVDLDGIPLLPHETYRLQWGKPPELNPVAEVEAATKKIKAGLSSWSDEMGPDADSVIGRLAADVAYMRETLGIDVFQMLQFSETRTGVPLADVKEEADEGKTVVKVPKA